MSIAAPILYHTFRAKRNVRPEQKADNSVITLNPLKSVLTYDAHIIPHRMTIAKKLAAPPRGGLLEGFMYAIHRKELPYYTTGNFQCNQKEPPRGGGSMQ